MPKTKQMTNGLSEERPALREVPPDRALAALTRAVSELSLAGTAGAVQQIVRTAARELTGADGATLVLRDGNQCFYVDEDAIEPLWKGQRFPLEACISGWAMLNRRPVVIEDIYADARIPHDPYRPTFVKSLVMVPIRSIDPLGAIGIYWATRHRATELQVGLARALADSTAIALENVRRSGQLDRANQLAGTDPLTAVANRRAWDSALGRALQPEGPPVCVLLIDLDRFKRYNDRHGHPGGDRLLRESAMAWKTLLRRDDLLARLGGEEFGVVLPDCDLDHAQAIADRLRDAIPDDQTASVGIARWDGSETAGDLVVRADRALYAAKTAGRDRTRVAEGQYA
jgi:diguanylate cyclase (GGDEF)-like protein